MCSYIDTVKLRLLPHVNNMTDPRHKGIVPVISWQIVVEWVLSPIFRQYSLYKQEEVLGC